MTSRILPDTGRQRYEWVYVSSCNRASPKIALRRTCGGYLVTSRTVSTPTLRTWCSYTYYVKRIQPISISPFFPLLNFVFMGRNYCWGSVRMFGFLIPFGVMNDHSAPSDRW